MKKVWKRSLLVLVALLLILQCFRPASNTAAMPGPRDITTKYAVPAPVLRLLQNSCYDCHSNHTRYPWYNKIQPMAWYLDRHIKEGKRELNFSEFAAYIPRKAAHKLDEIITEIGEGDMPLGSYTLIHRGTRLSEAEIRLIADWASALGDSIRTAYKLVP